MKNILLYVKSCPTKQSWKKAPIFNKHLDNYVHQAHKEKIEKKKRHSRTMLIYQNKFHLPISIKTDIIGNNPKASIFTPKAFNCDCLNRCQKQKDMRKKQRRSVTVRRLHSDDTQFMLLFGLLRPSLHFLIYLYPFVYPFIPLYISVHIF